MKDIALLVWFMQLGISVAAPLAGFVLIAIWLQNRFGLGRWVVIAAVILGIISAIDGLKSSLKTLEKLSRKDKEEEKTALSFNDHE
ncbi:MAG: AtpZ/AtpI family protein [Clostridia bacterium]|nr:AtpZ/AtpI family protein [Oscillospiraceae bacterium]MBQ6934636.1 AtpZ/AtpI family protein [Clostridia bacterium]